jgi:autotransporter passenger strand-loop-strand repeat protein
VGFNGLALGTVIASDGHEEVYGTVSGTTIIAGGGEWVFSGGITDNTRIAGGILVLSSGAAAGGTIVFSGGGTLDVTDSSALPSSETQIQGFRAGDSIDLSFLAYSAGDSYSVSDGVLTISAGGAQYDLTIEGAASGGFELRNDGSGGLEIVVCFYPGTGIRTPTGDVAVERLKSGDDVLTADGRVMAVRWVGRNTVSTRFADPLRVLPIRIRAGALAEAVPERDLLVSPEHAILVEDILVHAGALVNGISIIRERGVPERFVYHHIELAEHALILAEGTPAETFVDNIHRSAFDNWAEHEALYGDTPIQEMSYPRAQSHRQVPNEIHTRLMLRARTMRGRAAQGAGWGMANPLRSLS